MSEAADINPSLGSALSARYRGHNDRNWEEWHGRHFYPTASDIPSGADKALLGRQEKQSFRGIGTKAALRHLIVGNANQACLEEIGQLTDLERLELEYPLVATDLSPLLALRSLHFLSIDSPRKLSDFSLLLQLPALRTLLLTNARLMTDLDWLSDAHQLEVIGIEGGMDSTYTIPTFEPLRGLPSLEALLTTSTRLTERRLMPLADCSALKFMGTARIAPREEFDRLNQARPDLYCDWFQPRLWELTAGRRRKRADYPDASDRRSRPGSPARFPPADPTLGSGRCL